tara:strand:+ start:657 stop:1085 length:429 start_codon:yes stop_codon:yes gene_type:complete
MAPWVIPLLGTLISAGQSYMGHRQQSAAERRAASGAARDAAVAAMSGGVMPPARRQQESGSHWLAGLLGNPEFQKQIGDLFNKPGPEHQYLLEDRPGAGKFGTTQVLDPLAESILAGGSYNLSPGQGLKDVLKPGMAAPLLT